jgi:GNAT superfamily N-acetyltransferase
MMDAPTVVVREFEARDRARVREIARATNPVRPYVEDEELLPVLFADYYLDYEPEWCLVAEVDGRVVGYVMGATSARRNQWLVRVIPRVLFRVLWKLITFQYRRRKTYEMLWYLLARSWREASSVHLPLDRYPVHFHFQVEAEYKHLKLGLLLVNTFIEVARARGIKGLRGAIAEEEGEHKLSRFICRKLGSRVLGVIPAPLLNYLTDRKWVLTIVVKDL